MRGFDQEEKDFIREATNDLSREDHLLNLAIWNDFVDITEKIIEANRKFNNQKSIKTIIEGKLEAAVLYKQQTVSSHVEMEKILNDLKSQDWSAGKKRSPKVWHQQPLFKAIDKGQFAFICFLHFIGVSFGVKNEDGCTALEHLAQKISSQT